MPWRLGAVRGAAREKLAQLFVPHALGFAGKTLSGDKARAPLMASAFCASGETLLGWMAVGTPTRELATDSRKGTSEVLQYWVP